MVTLNQRPRGRKKYSPMEIFTVSEISAIHKRAIERTRRLDSHPVWTQLMVFELCVFCGMTSEEIARLEVRDVHLELDTIIVRPAGTRPRRLRVVHLSWYPIVSYGIVEYFSWRKRLGIALPTFITSLQHPNALDRQSILLDFQAACAGLVREGVVLNTLTGRNSFIAHSLAAHSAAEVAAAAGFSEPKSVKGFVYALRGTDAPQVSEVFNQGR